MDNWKKVYHKYSHKKIMLIELVLTTILAVLVFLLAGRFDILEKMVALSHEYETYEIDEIIVVAIFLTFVFAILSYRRLRELKKLNQCLELEVQAKILAQDEVNTLKGIIPICASCKSIRSDDGFWMAVETFIHQNSEAQFSHGICPTCVEKIYPELKQSE